MFYKFPRKKFSKYSLTIKLIMYRMVDNISKTKKLMTGISRHSDRLQRAGGRCDPVS
jgi:hypothetical protein